MSTKLLVGCPVRRREWVIGAWLSNIAIACEVAGVDDWAVALVADPRDPTVEVARDACERTLHLVECEEDVDTADRRDWETPGRYARMAELRNMLLAKARQLEPDLLLSIDSDILLHPAALVGMMSMLETGKYEAVGGKTYLTPNERLPNYAMITGGGSLSRPDSDGSFKVDVIMAIKLMTPAAYRIDYKPDPRGEDIGWSANARRAGVRLGWHGAVRSEHVMVWPLMGALRHE